MDIKNTIFQYNSIIKPTNLVDNNKINILCKKVCLFANARDEKHIKEWATHHLLLGFSKIIIFDHKSIIPLKEVFKNFDRRVKIIDAKNIEGSVKMTLMNKASQIAKALKMDWMIYLDADEFIILNKKFNGIKHLLSVYNHADSLGIHWLMFGSNFLEKDPDGLILENYTRSELILNEHLKSFTRPSKIINAMNPHYYNIKDVHRYFTINNKNLHGIYHSLPTNLNYFQTPAYIAHYVNQSEESFIQRKIHLPRDDTGEKRVCNDIKEIHHQHNLIENNDYKNKYSQKIKFLLRQYGHEF
jgi:hypothetical protein